MAVSMGLTLSPDKVFFTMPKQADALTPSAVANAKPKAESYRMPEGRGMFLLVQPSGAKGWHMATYSGRDRIFSNGFEQN